MATRAVEIERVEAEAYTNPTDAPEADGTFAAAKLRIHRSARD